MTLWQLVYRLVAEGLIPDPGVPLPHLSRLTGVPVTALRGFDSSA
jgi:hypothetical protein